MDDPVCEPLHLGSRDLTGSDRHLPPDTAIQLHTGNGAIAVAICNVIDFR